MTTISNTNSAMDDAVRQISQQFEKEYEAIARLEKDAEDIANDLAQIAADEAAIDKIEGDPLRKFKRKGGVIRRLNRDIAAKNADRAAKEADIKQIEAELEKLDPSFKDLSNALNTLLEGLKSAAKDNPDVSLQDFRADVQKVMGYIKEIGKAMEEKAEADKCAALIEDGGNGLTDAEREALAQQMIQHQGAEQSILYALVDKMASDLTDIFKEENSAKVKKAGIHWYNEIFGNGTERKARYEAIIKNAEKMMQMIQAVTKEISPELSSLTPDLAQMINTINNVVKEITKILDSALSSEEKGDKILALMVFALGLLSTVVSMVAKDKAEADKRMNEVSTYTTRMNIDHEITQQQIMKKELQYAHVMKIVMKISMIFVGVIMTVLAPGVGTALLMAAMTALEASGALDTLTKKLGSFIGSKAGAEAMIAALEVATTVGGGAVVDSLTKVVEKEVTQAVMKAVESSIQQTIEDTVTLVMEKSPNLSEDAVRNIIKMTVTDAAEQAAAKTFTLFSKQSGGAIFASIIKNGGITAATESKIEEAILSAANKAAENAVPLAEKAVTGPLEAATISELERIATAAANESASALTIDKTAEDVAKSTVEKTAGAKAISRGVYSSIYSLASSNLLIELMEAIQKARGKGKDDDAFQILVTFMRILQMLIAMAAQLSGSGLMSSVVFADSSATLSKIANYGQIAGTGADAIGAYGTGDAELGQAKAVKAIAKDNATIDTFQFILEQLKKDGNAERARALKEIAQISRTTTRLSCHLYDSGAMLAKVLTEQAV